MARKAAAQIDPKAKLPDPEPVIKDQDIEVDITEPEPETAETPASVAAESTADSPTPASSPTPGGEDVAALRQRLQEMERAEQLARQQVNERDTQIAERDRQVADAQRKERQSQWQAWNDRKTAIDNLIGSAQSMRDAAKQEYRAAREAGDIERETEAQEKLAEATATIQTYTREKTGMEEREAQWKQQRQQRPQRQQQPQQQQPPTIEQIIDGSQIPERAKVWLRAHPDYISDPAKNNQLIKMHNVAEYQAGGEFTDEYFNRIEVLLGLKQEQRATNGGGVAPSPIVQRQAAPVSAPPTREAPSMTTGRAPESKVHMSKEEVEIALANKWSEDEPDRKAIERYARNKQKMMKAKANGEIP